MSEPSHSDSFLTLARYASAFACAIASGFLYSLKRVNPSLQLEVGFGTLLAFILGGVITLCLWRVVQEIAGKGGVPLSAEELRRRRVTVTMIAAVLFGTLGFSYAMALKNVTTSSLLQVMQGVGLALLVVAGIGVVMMKLIRLLNQDDPPEGSTGESDPTDHDPDAS